MSPVDQAPVRPRQGFTILETIGVLSILAILAALLIPPVVGRINAARTATERKSLRSLGEALERQILARGGIPDGEGWVDRVAEELAIPRDRAARSLAGNRRVYLVDPDFSFGDEPVTLPWTQPPSGVAGPPVHARVLIVSSQGWPLPDLEGGGIETRREVFERLWHLPDDTVPVGWPAEWADEGESLLIHRLDLTPLFHRLAVTILAPGQLPEMAVGEGEAVAIAGTGREGWFLDGSVIQFRRNGQPDFREMLTEDRAYFLEHGGWRGQLREGRDEDAVLDAFLSARRHPLAAEGSTPHALADAYYQYGLAWSAWSGAGFPTTSLEGAVAPEYASVANAWIRLDGIASGLLPR